MCLWLLACGAAELLAVEKLFSIGGTTVLLQDVSADVAVYFQYMRSNRALNVWNVEVIVTNQGSRTLNGPWVLLVDDFQNTTGAKGADGYDDSTPAKAYYDFTALVPKGALATGESSGARTLTLGVGAGAPVLVTKVYAGRELGGAGLAFTRSLNEAGQPLPGVRVAETGPVGSKTYTTDPVFGVATLGQGSGAHTWKFSVPGHLPAWRQQVLSSNVAVLPNPRLVAHSTNVVVVTPMGGGHIGSPNSEIQFHFPPGAMSQDTPVTLTPLGAQDLPAFLPVGWSPLQGFWFESAAEPASPVDVALLLWGPLGLGEMAALTRWNEPALKWEVVQLLTGSGTNAANAGVTANGAYALVVGDPAPNAPPAPQVGQGLLPVQANQPDAASLSASGSVIPSSSPASRRPELVTATAEVAISNRDGTMPSGLALRCEVTETYRLNDGTRRRPPQYESFVVGYQRPGDTNQSTVHTRFPLRPLLLFGAEELAEATVKVDVLPPAEFTGGVLDAGGGLVSSGGVQVLAGTNDVIGRQAAQLRQTAPTNFVDFETNGIAVAAAFEFSVAGVAPDHRLLAQVRPLPSNRHYVLARVLYVHGQCGLSPVERLTSDSTGRLSSAEPPAGERLPGIDGSGQYLLLQVPAPLALLRGVARDAAGRPSAGLSVLVVDQPWLSFSDTNGSYRLIAPTGAVAVAVTDLGTGNTGSLQVNVGNPQAVITADVGVVAVGPRVVSVTPEPGATAVSRVAPVVVTFSKPVNPATLLGGGLQLVEAGGLMVDSSLTLNLANMTVTLLPSRPLVSGTVYTLQLSSDIADPNGMKLEGTAAFTFKTESEQLVRVAGEVVSYEPTNGLAGITGSPGVADPESPVVLMNETTGFTVTVLSLLDGSFSNSIPAEVDDVLSTLVVNQNGTRTPVPVTRQVFQDGSVALYTGGGLVAAPGPNGPTELQIHPGSIPNKTKFKLEHATTNSVYQAMSNAPPADATLLGAFRLRYEGDPLRDRAEVSFPVTPADLNLPPGESPTNRVYALLETLVYEGVPVYVIVDTMSYENGRLVTHSLFPGMMLGTPGSAVLFAIAMMPFAAHHQLIVGGIVVVAPASIAHSLTADQIRARLAQGGSSQLRAVPGAIVNVYSSALAGTLVSQPQGLRPGIFVARAGWGGRYTSFIPYNPLQAEGVAVVARSSLLPNLMGVRGVPVPMESRGITVDVVIEKPDTSNGLVDETGPLVSMDSPSAVLPVGAQVEVPFLLRDDLSQPNLLSLQLDAAQSVATQTGEPINAGNVSWSVGQAAPMGATMVQIPVTFLVTTSALVTLKVKAADQDGNISETPIALHFGAAPRPTPGNVPVIDPDDRIGPRVITAYPNTDATIQTFDVFTLQFSEAVAPTITNGTGVSISGPSGPVALRVDLSPDQRLATVIPNGLQAGKDYTLSLAAAVTDVNGNSLDQDPAQAGNNPFVVPFHTAEETVVSLPGPHNPAGTVVLGAYAFTLDKSLDTLNGALYVHRLGPVNQEVASTTLPPMPRAMALIPRYAFRRRPGAAIEDKPLLVVVGGRIGIDQPGQWMRVIDISKPLEPARVATAFVTTDYTAVAANVKASGPRVAVHLVTVEGALIQMINLQALILGNNYTADDWAAAPAGGNYVPGTDLNGDGDYVDDNEVLPVPQKFDLFGLESVFPVFSGAVLADFDISDGGAFMVGALQDRLQAFTFQGLPVGMGDPGDPAGALLFSDTRVTRVKLDLDFPFDDGISVRRTPVALVTGGNYLFIVKLTNPHQPVILRTLRLGDNVGSAVAIVRSGPDEYSVGSSSGIYVLRRSAMSLMSSTDKPHSSVLEVVNLPVSGRAMGATPTFWAASSGNAGAVLRAPNLSFVQVLRHAVTGSQALIDQGRGAVDAFLALAQEGAVLLPGQVAPSVPEISSDIAPPNPAVHHYALVTASGEWGETIKLAVESLDSAGELVPPKGQAFPPVILTDVAASLGVTALQPSVTSLTARRLSDDAASELYNRYLADPILIVREPVPAIEAAALREIPGRQAIWSGPLMRLSIDANQSGPGVVTYAGAILNKRYMPSVGRTYPALAGEYMDCPNVSFPLAAPRVSGVDLQSGEFRHPQMDIFIEGRELDVVLMRTYASCSRYAGTFGPGWDFNLNARLFELPEQMLPADFQLPIRPTGTGAVLGGAGDVLFIDGNGGVHLFRKINDAHQNMAQRPSYDQDPAIKEFYGANGIDKFEAFYESPPGVFTVLYKMKDGSFWLIEPTGIRTFFEASGRMTKIIGRSPKSQIEFFYRADGKLDRVIGDRGFGIEFGYYFRMPSHNNRPADIATDEAHKLGKIARVRSNESLANASSVDYDYDSNGSLLAVTPKFGAETIHRYDPQDLNLMVAIGRGDGTALPGLTIGYEDGRVKSLTQDGETKTFSGSVKTARDRYRAGDSVVSVTHGGNTARIQIDNRGRPTSFANRRFSANDQGQPTYMEDAEDGVTLIYDSPNPIYRFRGNLVRSERSAGSGKFVSDWTYDESTWNRLEKSTDVNGVETTYTYTATPSQTVEQCGEIARTFALNDWGQITLDDLNGELIRHHGYGFASLSADGGLETDLHAENAAATTIARDTIGRTKTVSEPGRSYTVYYNDDGQVESIMGALVPELTMRYENGLPSFERLVAGAQQWENSVEYRDPRFKTHVTRILTSESGLASTETKYFYNSQGQLERLLLDGEETRFTYDGLRQTGLRGPGRSREATFDANGRMVTLTEQGLTATFIYDEGGRVKSVTQQGARTVFTYDDTDRGLGTRLKSKEIVDVAGGTTLLSETYGYDAAGRVESVTSGNGRVRTYEHFADGAVKTRTVSGLLVGEVGRDTAGRITSSRINDVTYTFADFDPTANAPRTETVTLLPSGAAVTRLNTYDVKGRLSAMETPDGVYAFEYDDFGHRKSETDPDGVKLQNTFSPTGFRLTRTLGDGTPLTYGYTPQRRLESILGPAGALTLSYDAEGLVSQINYPDGSRTRFSNRNASTFEPVTVEEGDVAQQLTWVEDRLTQISAGSDVQTYAYDGLGRRTTASLNGHQVTFLYNGYGEPVGEATEAGTWMATLDVKNILQKEVYPSNLELNFQPDDYGLPTALSAVGIAAVSWLGVGALETYSLSDGLKVIRSYDTSLRTDAITYLVTTNNTETVIASFEYKLSPGGRPDYEYRSHDDRFDVFVRGNASAARRIEGFSFGATNELGEGAQAEFGQISFNNGELQAPLQGSATDPRGFFPALASNGQRLTSADGQPVSYNARGSIENVPLWVQLPGQSLLTRVQASLRYDGLGMLGQVTRSDSVTVAYTRDGLSRIIRRVVTGPADRCDPGETQYVWKGRQLIEEREDIGAGPALTRRYIYLGRYLVMVQSALTPGAALANYIPLVNLNGSICGYATPEGRLLETIHYSAYGVPRFESQGDLTSRSAIAGTLLFHGAWYDAATGLYQIGVRNLHPVLGRFLQRESHVFSQSAALYTAFEGDPVGRRDPLGTQSVVAAAEDVWDKLNAVKDKVSNLHSAADSLVDAVNAIGEDDEDRQMSTIGVTTADFLGQITALATTSADEEIAARATRMTSFLSTAKDALGYAESFEKIFAARDALDAVKAKTWASLVYNIPQFASLGEAGASFGPAVLRELDGRLGGDPKRVRMTESQFYARSAYSALKGATEEYASKREEFVLGIGEGVIDIARVVYEKTLEQDGGRSAEIAKGALGIGDALIGMAKAYREAREADDLALVFLGRQGFSQIALSKAGRGAVFASYQLGFEVGKLLKIVLSDPKSAKIYQEELARFDKDFANDGGYVTVLAGMLNTIGVLPDSVTMRVTYAATFNWKDALDSLLQFNLRMPRKQEYYLEGLEEP